MSRSNRRSFLQTSLASGAALAVGASLKPAHAAANDEVGIGVIGAGGRGGEVGGGFKGRKGARIVAVADPDENRAGGLAEKLGASDSYQDLRKLLDNPSVDAVVITTCNHWHCLAAIWAMQAGKDVYVEKPLSHSQWEGRQVVNAARKYNKIVQLGTQQRSDPLQEQLKKFLHQDKELGEIQYVQANRLGVRGSIGKRETPLPIPPGVDYDLWCGPAEMKDLYREKLHYDWHWDWNTGSGEMGNWGVHILDDIRNVAYQDSVSTPKRILAVGGRVAWNDAGETPNVHYAYFDTGTFPTLIVLSNLPKGPKERGSWETSGGRPTRGPGSGYVVACEGGYLLGQRGRAMAVDKEGKQIRTFKGGDMNKLHQENFLTAVRERDRSILNSEIESGHHSSGWCNLANIAYRASDVYSQGTAESLVGDIDAWGVLLREMHDQLKPFGVRSDELRLSPILEHDPKTEWFTGEHAETANQFVKRDYRKGYEVPDFEA